MKQKEHAQKDEGRESKTQTYNKKKRNKTYVKNL